jgi:hypothetical protein
MARLGTMCVSYQGEVNETNESKPNRNAISRDSADGPLVLRGSNLTLYMIREASQGEPLYLRLDAFLAGKAADSKAFHHRTRRVGFQRSSPQNNFRRIVAAPIEAGQFCFDTVSYIPESESRLSLHELLALLNSQLLDWYFRLGSTNSKVNEYQFNNLPVPRFAEVDADARAVARGVLGRMDAGDFEGAFVRLQTHLVTPPFSGAVRLSLAALVERIIDSESRRGPITRRERANLSVSAQPFQDLVDRILFAAAGITDREGASLTQRLAQML